MKFDLIILEGAQAGRRIALGSEPVVFGRSAEVAFSFPQDNFMSGRHLTAQQSLGGVYLVDQRSTNGTLLNGQRITQAEAVAGDVVKIGSLTMLVVAADANTAVLSSAPPVAAATSRPSAAENLPAAMLTRLAQGPLFCLLDAAADEMIPSLLSLAQEPKQCLYDGDSAVTLARWAPYLVQLEPQSPLLQVLTEKGWGKGWASYFTSDAPFDEIRKHFRRFLMVQVEGGKEVYFRFYDPRVLRDFLPTANPSEMVVFFGPVTAWFLEGENKQSLLKVSNAGDGLHTDVLSLEGIRP